MKTAIYIEDGVTQLVLTPDNKFEQDVVGRIESVDTRVAIYRGEFYHCQGGWNRHGGGETSLMLRLTVNPKVTV